LFMMHASYSISAAFAHVAVFFLCPPPPPPHTSIHAQNIQELLSAHLSSGHRSSTVVTPAIDGSDAPADLARDSAPSEERLSSESHYPIFESPPPSPPDCELFQVCASESAAAAAAAISCPRDECPLAAPSDLKEDPGSPEDIAGTPAPQGVACSHVPSLTVAEHPSPKLRAVAETHSCTALQLPVSSHHTHGPEVFSPGNYMSSFNILRLSFHKSVPNSVFYIFPHLVTLDRLVFATCYNVFAGTSYAAESITTP
jgi:hypothetical protein